MRHRTVTGYCAHTHADTNTGTPTQTHTDALGFRRNRDLCVRRQVPLEEQKTGTPAPPKEMSAAVDEPGSAVEFLERLASLLLIRLLVTESRVPSRRVTPRCYDRELGAHLGHGPSSSLSLSLNTQKHTETHTRTRTHTHAFPLASEGLEGNVCVLFMGGK